MGGENSKQAQDALSLPPLEIMVKICEDRRDPCQVPDSIKTKKLTEYCTRVWPRLTSKAPPGTVWPKTGSFDANKISMLKSYAGQNSKMKPYIRLWERVGRRRARAKGSLQAFSAVLPPFEEKQEGFEDYLDAIFISSQALPPAPPLGGGAGGNQNQNMPLGGEVGQNPNVNQNFPLGGGGLNLNQNQNYPNINLNLNQKVPAGGGVQQPPTNALQNNLAPTENNAGNPPDQLNRNSVTRSLYPDPSPNAGSPEGALGLLAGNQQGLRKTWDEVSLVNNSPKIPFSYTVGTTTITGHIPRSQLAESNPFTSLFNYSPSPSLTDSRPMSLLEQSRSSWTTTSTPNSSAYADAKTYAEQTTGAGPPELGLRLPQYDKPPAYNTLKFAVANRNSASLTNPSAPPATPELRTKGVKGNLIDLRQETPPQPIDLTKKIQEELNDYFSKTPAEALPGLNASQELREEVGNLVDKVKEQEHMIKRLKDSITESTPTRKDPKQAPKPTPRKPARSSHSETQVGHKKTDTPWASPVSKRRITPQEATLFDLDEENTLFDHQEAIITAEDDFYGREDLSDEEILSEPSTVASGRRGEARLYPSLDELNQIATLESLQNSLQPRYRGYKVLNVVRRKNGRLYVTMKNLEGQNMTYALNSDHFRPECGLFPIRTFPNLTGYGTGDPIRTYQPWSAGDLFSFKQSFPNPRQDIDGFLKALRELYVIYDPMPADLERLLKALLDGVDFTRVMQRAREAAHHPWPPQTPSPTEREITAQVRTDAHDLRETLIRSLAAQFPKKIDWTKITALQQAEDEHPRAYYSRLVEAVRQHSAIDPDDPAQGPQITPWFMQGILPVIADKIKDTIMEYSTKPFQDILTAASQMWENYNQKRRKEVGRGRIETPEERKLNKALVSLKLDDDKTQDAIEELPDKIAERIESAVIGLAGVLQQNQQTPQFQNPSNFFQPNREQPFQRKRSRSFSVPANSVQFPTPRYQTQGPGGVQQQGAPPNCFNCGQIGHIRRFCPNPQINSQFPPGSQQPRQQLQPAPQQQPYANPIPPGWTAQSAQPAPAPIAQIAAQPAPAAPPAPSFQPQQLQPQAPAPVHQTLQPVPAPISQPVVYYAQPPQATTAMPTHIQNAH